MRFPVGWAAALALAGASARSEPAARPRAEVVICDDVQDPLTLDPQKEFSEKNHTLVQQIFEGLVRFDPDGKIEPALALSWSRLDPLRVRFRLREGVRFHDGEPFDAEAVRFSIARYLDPKTGFPAAGFLAPFDRAEVVDEHTVDLVTKFPDGLLLNRLAGFVVIVPPRYLREQGDEALGQRPVGTGPFRFVRWDRGRGIFLEANPDYWSKGLPGVRSLEFRFVPWDRQVDELLAGRLDLVTELPGTRTTEVTASRSAKVVKRETFYTMVATFNQTSGPLADLRVRQALNFGVDKNDLIRFDLLGNGVPMASLAMPGEEGRAPDLIPYPYDPDRARRLLAEAGYPKGLELSTLVKEEGLRSAKIIKSQLARVGVRLKLETTTDSAMVGKMAQRHWDLSLGGTPDPMVHSYFIEALILYSKSPYALGGAPGFDARLDDMATTIDAEERERKGRDLDRLIHDQALSLFTYRRIKTYGVAKRLKFTPWVTGMPYLYGLQWEKQENPAALDATPR